MKIVTRQEAGKFRVGESLVVTILEIGAKSVKLGLAASCGPTGDSLNDLFQIHSNRRGYYRFPEHGERLFVLELTKGQRVALNGSGELLVLEVRSACVTVAICSGCECEQFRRDDSVAAQEHTCAAT